MANALAQAGAAVAVFDVNGEGADAAVAEIRSFGGQALAVAIDVTDSQLLKQDNVVLTPRMAAHEQEDEALLRMALVVEDVIAVLEGHPPKNPVLPD